MKKSRKAFLACLMSLMMTLVMAAPMSVSAAEKTVGTAEELTSAISEAADGDVIKLTANLNISETVVINKKITIDLNGNNITATPATTFSVSNGALEVKGSGEINVSGEAFRLAGNKIQGEEPIPAELIIGQNVKVESANDCCVYMYGDGSKVDVYGSLLSKGEYATIQGNGTYKSDDDRGNTIINIHESAVVEHSTGHAVYHPQHGTISVAGTVKGNTAIEMRAGELTVEPTAEIISTGETYISNPNGNGSASQGGGAIVVAQHTTKLPINVTIRGGEITGPAALIADGVQNGSTDNVNIEVQGGAFEGSVEVAKDGGEIVVEGGAFTDLDNETVTVKADDMVVISDGNETATVVGIDLINAVLEELAGEENITVEVIKATEDSNFEVPDGIKVENSTDISIKVNDEEVKAGEDIEVGEGNTNENGPSTPSTTPSDPSKTPADDSAKTGDNSNLLIPMILMLIAAAGIGTTVAVRGRK